MKISIIFTTNNDTFRNNPEEMRFVLAKALVAIDKKLSSYPLRDSNGDVVGNVTVKNEAHDKKKDRHKKREGFYDPDHTPPSEELKTLRKDHNEAVKDYTEKHKPNNQSLEMCREGYEYD